LKAQRETVEKKERRENEPPESYILELMISIGFGLSEMPGYSVDSK